MEKVEINGDLFESLHKNNFIRALIDAGVLGKTRRVNLETGMIELTLPPGSQDIQHDWIHTRQDKDEECGPYHTMFKAFGFIPTPCLSCWKVVVKPRTIVELFKLYNLQVDLNRQCKCGIEQWRPYVNPLYGGYFYNESKEEGFERYHEVRQSVDEQISPDVPVVLKRFCTEFELRFGDSKGYQQPKMAKKWEAMMDKWYVRYPSCKEQSPLIVIDIMERWIHFAMRYGDPTVKEINNGEFLYPSPRTYHEEEE